MNKCVDVWKNNWTNYRKKLKIASSAIVQQNPEELNIKYIGCVHFIGYLVFAW